MGDQMTAVPVHRVLSGVCLTEKSAFLAEHRNTYTFNVHIFADKTQIKMAVQEHFGVKVISVNTLHRAGRVKRFKGRQVETPEVKKAIVKVDSSDRIALY